MIFTVLLFILITILLILHFVNIKLLMKLYLMKMPSPSPCYPLIGHAPLVFGLNEEERLKMLTNLFLTYPRYAKFWYGPVPIIGVSHPDLIQKILLSNECLEKSYYFYKMYDLSDSLIAAKCQKWKTDRKILNHSFNLKILESFVTVFQECASDMNRKLSKHLDGNSFDILHYVSNCMLDMLMKTSYDLELMDFGNQENDEMYEEMIDAVDNIYKGMSKRFNNPLLHPVTIYKHTSTYQNEQTARHLAASYQEKLYEKRKEFLKFSSTDKNNGKFHTFIDQLILNEDKFDRKTIRDNLVLLLLAGFETTSSETSHVLMMLAMFKDIQDKVYQEICEIFHSEDVGFDIETLNKLHYMDQVIKETMRLFPIAPHISRTVSERDIKLDDFVIPVGTIIFFNLFALHRRTDYWGPEAHKFNPDNFSQDKVHQRHPFSFLPFSAGKRNCLGQRYAVNSMKIFLVTLLKEFEISTDLKFEELRFKSDVTLKLCMPHSVKLKKRC